VHFKRRKVMVSENPEDIRSNVTDQVVNQKYKIIEQEIEKKKESAKRSSKKLLKDTQLSWQIWHDVMLVMMSKDNFRSSLDLQKCADVADAYVEFLKKRIENDLS